MTTSCCWTCVLPLPSALHHQIAEGHKKVLALLDHLNVDASNPLAVLTQVWTQLCCMIKLLTGFQFLASIMACSVQAFCCEV